MHYVPTGSVGHLVYRHEGSLRAVPFDASKQALLGKSVSIIDGVGHIAASGSGRLVFVRPETGARKLMLVTQQGKARTLIEELASYSRPRFSPDGTRVATMVGGRGIFCLRRRKGHADPCDRGRALQSRVDAPTERRSRSTPYQEGTRDVFWKSADGTGEAESLLTREQRQWPSGWSPDGDWLALSELDPETGWDIWMLPVQGDRSPSSFLITDANERFSRFSPDGRFVAFVSDDSGRDEVFVLPFPGPGEKLTISPAGGTAPMWSRDGRQLFYRNGGTDARRRHPIQPNDIRWCPETSLRGAPSW